MKLVRAIQKRARVSWKYGYMCILFFIAALWLWYLRDMILSPAVVFENELKQYRTGDKTVMLEQLDNDEHVVGGDGQTDYVNQGDGSPLD